MNMKKKSFMILLAFIMATAAVGCGNDVEEAPLVVIEQDQEETAYNFGMATKDDVILTKRIKCVYKQMRDQEVSFGVSGKRIDKVFVEKGDSVKKGDLLAQLSGGNLDDRIQQLEYNIKRNEMLKRHAEVNEDLDISQRWVTAIYHGAKNNVEEDVKDIQKNYRYMQEDYDDSLELDRMELAKLKAEKSASFVYAEMDGTVYQIKDRLEGSTSEKDKVIMTIVDGTECLFETSTPEYIDKFHEGDMIAMNISTSGAAGDYEVTPYNISEWGETQYFSVVSGPENDGIEVGTSGYMTLILEQKKDVLSVPRDSVYKAGDKYYVYVLGDDGMKVVTWITVGVYGDNRVEVLDGLSEGDKVILK